MRGVQCGKALYLRRYSPELAGPDDDSRSAVFQRGSEIGLLARELFPDGVDASANRPGEMDAWIERTRSLIDGGAKVIYEAAFSFEGLFAAIDILVRDGQSWRGYEVKSSAHTSETHKLDAAFQAHVIESCGLELSDIFIVHLNSDYVRNGDLQVDRLFKTESVLPDVRELTGFVRSESQRLRKLLTKKTHPNVDIGPHCTAPYACDFMVHCWRHIPEDSVFEVARLHDTRKWQLYKDNILRMIDIPGSFRLNQRQRHQIECARTGRAILDRPAIREFMNSLNYPLYCMDFETFMPAVPPYDGLRPYQQVPFQYSLHYLASVDASPEHAEFIAEPGCDPRRNFIEHLLRHTQRPGTILVYNQVFEKLRLRELRDYFPDLSRAVDERIARLRDLMEPFQKGFFLTREMRGSYSIKAVLPALVPGAGYESLEIGDGEAAMQAYTQLSSPDSALNRDATMQSLLAYCKQDTFAMVQILEALHDLAGKSDSTVAP